MADISIRNTINSLLSAIAPEHRTDEHDDSEIELEGAEAHEDDEHDPDLHRAGSVVKSTYKLRYRERADNRPRKPKDVSKKALRRCNGDWLAIELARLTLDPKNHVDVAAFEAILDANQVNHSHWNRTTRGWQGRLRMTGRLALQRVVAENNGELRLPDGSTLQAPRTWVERTLR